MSLKTLYEEAAPNTYAGLVRTKQAADAPANQTLVNFLDGQAKGIYRKGRPLSQDQFQTEFTRNSERSFLSAGAQGPARSENQTLTRWTDKAFKIAFDGEGPSQLKNGFYTNQFRSTYIDVDGTQKQVHAYTPLAGKRFGDVNANAKARIVSSPSGAPTGPTSL